MKKTLKGLASLALALALVTPNAHAADIWTMAESPSYGRKALGMVGRGLLNVITSPVDLIVQTVDKTKSGPPIIGTLAGLGSGLGCTIVRAGSGVIDVVTFWVPSFNGIPVSRSYSNCLESADAGKNWEGSQYAAPAAAAGTWAASTAPGATTWQADDANRYVDKNGAGNRYVDKNGSPYSGGAQKYVNK
jgi:putative exosortase-associated protein (TIGR04073 family)